MMQRFDSVLNQRNVELRGLLDDRDAVICDVFQVIADEDAQHIAKRGIR